MHKRVLCTAHGANCAEYQTTSLQRKLGVPREMIQEPAKALLLPGVSLLLLLLGRELERARRRRLLRHLCLPPRPLGSDLRQVPNCLLRATLEEMLLVMALALVMVMATVLATTTMHVYSQTGHWNPAPSV